MASEDFKIKDSHSYDQVVDSFEHLTKKYTAPFAEKLIKLSGITGKDTVLDVGTGTGVVALEAAGKLGSGGKVVGIDLSKGLMQTAEKNAKKTGLADRTEFQYMDAEALEFKDESFDTVVSLYALLHFPHPDIALKEIRRVVRIGGKVVIAIGSGPPLFSWDGLTNTIIRVHDKLLQIQDRQLEAPTYLDNLVREYLPMSKEPEESELAKQFRNRSAIVPKLMQSAQLQTLGHYWLGLREKIDKPEDFWEIQATFSSIARKRLAQGTAEKLKIIKEEFLSKCNKVLGQGGNLIYLRGAFYIVAERRE